MKLLTKARFSDRREALIYAEHAQQDWVEIAYCYRWLCGPKTSTFNEFDVQSRKTAEGLMRGHGWSLSTVKEAWSYGHEKGWLAHGEITWKCIPPKPVTASRSGKTSHRRESLLGTSSSDPIGEWDPPPRIARDEVEKFAGPERQREILLEASDRAEQRGNQLGADFLRNLAMGGPVGRKNQPIAEVLIPGNTEDAEGGSEERPW